MTDLNSKTPIDLASSSHIRELIIVYSPQNAAFKPNEQELNRIAIDGNTMAIKPVTGLYEQTNYYEPFEHAQPRKPKGKINTKPSN